MNKNTKGFISVILIIAAAAVLAVAVIYISTQGGKKTGTQYNFPGITQQASPAPAIQSASDLKTTQKDLDTTDIDGAMNTELNLLNADGAGL